jgi:polysaccharide deacetylase family protein (PEP-CTERM system associated)
MSRCLLSFDIEDWFHAHNLKPKTEREDWDRYELRVDQNTQKILDLLDEFDVRATFFVLGWVANRLPELVEEIDSRGHEVASHGYNHQLLYEQSTAEIRRDLRQSIDVLEPLVENSIRGYRAPSFSITDEALEILADLGFGYDSSSFPVQSHDRYGSVINSSSKTFVELNCDIVEAQLPRLEALGKGFPWAGGGYFRFIPYPVFRRGVEQITQERDYIFYLHPWELDPEQPRFNDLPFSSRLRHYTNLSKTRYRLRQLLADFDWQPIGDVV